MKTNILVISILFCFSVFVTVAQEEVEITVSPKKMSQGIQTAFTVFIPESDIKLVEKEWKKFVNKRSAFEFATKGTSQAFEKAYIGLSNAFSKEKKSFNKKSLKVEKIDDELIVKNVIHENVTNKYVDIFSQIIGTKEGVYLNAFIKFSDSIFISKENITEDAQNAIQNYIREFGVETYRRVVEGQLHNEQEDLHGKEVVLKKMKKKNKSLNNSIGRYESKIDEYTYNISTLKTDLDRIEERITFYKESLNQVSKNSVKYDSIKNSRKEKERERRKTQKKIKSYIKKIKHNQTNIKNANADILDNEKDQELQIEIINNQEKHVEKFEKKLSNIK